MTDGAITIASAPQPRARVRIEHRKTLKEGWGYETTVELEWFGAGVLDDANAIARLCDLMNEAREAAKQERDRRNAEDSNDGTE